MTITVCFTVSSSDGKFISRREVKLFAKNRKVTELPCDFTTTACRTAYEIINYLEFRKYFMIK